MISSKQKFIPDKTYIKTIALDMLLGLSIGLIISLLVFLGFYQYKGTANLMEILPMFFVLIIFNSPYSNVFRLVLLVPIYSSTLSILVTKPFIQKTTSRKSWIIQLLVSRALQPWSQSL
jgi:hypothetical protein